MCVSIAKLYIHVRKNARVDHIKDKVLTSFTHYGFISQSVLVLYWFKIYSYLLTQF